MYRLLAADLHSQLAHRLERVEKLAEEKDTSLPAAREYVEAMLGFEVYANQVYHTLHADPHGEHQHS